MSTTSERPENVETSSGPPTSAEELRQEPMHERRGRQTRGRVLTIALVSSLIIAVAAGGFFALGGPGRLSPFWNGEESLSDALGPVVSPLASDSDSDEPTLQDPVLEPAERRGPQSDRLDGRSPALKGTRTPPADLAAAGDVEEIRQGLDALARRVEALEARTSTSQTQEGIPAEEILALREQVAQLANLPQQIASLREELDTTRGQLLALGEAVETVGAEVASIRTESSPDLAGASLNQAISLYDRGQYDEALEILQELQTSIPEDARVWYFSALAHAFATGNWEGEQTREYFQQGVERERAGTPPSLQIDAVMEGISKAKGRDWVDYYRRRAQQ